MPSRISREGVSAVYEAAKRGLKRIVHRSLEPFPEVDGPPTHVEQPIFLGSVILAGVVTLATLWALLAPLDEGLVISGAVSAEGSRVVVQHPIGGTVATIEVSEGQRVEASQVLARLDSRQLSVALDSLKTQSAGVQRQLNGIREVMVLRQKQLSSLQQEALTMERLVEGGYFAPAKQRDLERNIMELRQQLVQAEQTKNSLENQLSELGARQYSTGNDLERAEIKAPTAGVIVVSHINSVGAVVGPGDRIFEILPANKRLIVEGQIPRHMARNLSLGTEVVIRFSTLAAQGAPTLKGELFFMSPDTITPQQSMEPVFVVRVRSEVKDNQVAEYMQPGIPVELLVRTGEHTMFQYLTKSISNYLFRSLN